MPPIRQGAALALGKGVSTGLAPVLFTKPYSRNRKSLYLICARLVERGLRKSDVIGKSFTASRGSAALVDHFEGISDLTAFINSRRQVLKQSGFR